MSELKLSVEHLGLAARDTAALKDWYVRVLGGRVVFDNGQQPAAFFVELGGGLMIEIYPATNSLTTLCEMMSLFPVEFLPIVEEIADTTNNGLAGWRHLALRVDSIEAARRELESRGVAFTESPKPAGGGGRVLFFKDPEGNLLHFVERPADSVFRSGGP